MSSGKVLVNGAAGFLGSHAVEYLVEAGYKVRATDLPGSDLSIAESRGAETVRADLLLPETIPPLLEGMDQVVNIAGLFKYSLPLEVLTRANVEVTRNMCEASLKAGVKRLVHISSIAAYGTPRTCPMREDAVCHPENNYERTKFSGEELVLRYHKEKGLPAVVLRPAGIYGPRSKYGQTSLICLLALVRNSGRASIPALNGGPTIHFVHERDVAQAIEVLLRAEGVIGSCYNVADDLPLSQGELFQTIMQAYGLRAMFKFPYFTRLYWPFLKLFILAPDRLLERVNSWLDQKWKKLVESHDLEPMLSASLDKDYFCYMRTSYLLDTTRLKALGFRPAYPDPRKGLVETIRWYQEKGWLPRFEQ